MAKINLLPTDLGPKASVLKLANLGKKLAVIISLSFLIFGLLLVGYILFLNLELKSSSGRETNLKNSITSLKSTEQSLYLLKERLNKIKTLLEKDTEGGAFETTKSLSYPGITFTQIAVTGSKIEISASSQDSAAVGAFLNNILVNESYEDIKLTSFSLNPKLGYVFGLELVTQ